MKTITIPIDLARLLMADDSDFNNTQAAEDARGVARASLRLLIGVKQDELKKRNDRRRGPKAGKKGKPTAAAEEPAKE